MVSNLKKELRTMITRLLQDYYKITYETVSVHKDRVHMEDPQIPV